MHIAPLRRVVATVSLLPAVAAGDDNARTGAIGPAVIRLRMPEERTDQLLHRQVVPGLWQHAVPNEPFREEPTVFSSVGGGVSIAEVVVAAVESHHRLTGGFVAMALRHARGSGGNSSGAFRQWCRPPLCHESDGTTGFRQRFGPHCRRSAGDVSNV